MTDSLFNATACTVSTGYLFLICDPVGVTNGGNPAFVVSANEPVAPATGTGLPPSTSPLNYLLLADRPVENSKRWLEGFNVFNTIQFGMLPPIPIIHPPLRASVLPFLEGGELESLDITNPGLHIAQILLHGITVTIQTQPGRVDLIAYQANEPTAPLNLDLDLELAVAALRSAVIGIAHPIGATRLAVIVTLATICESADAVTSYISAHTNGFVPPVEAGAAIDIDGRVLPRSADREIDGGDIEGAGPE